MKYTKPVIVKIGVAFGVIRGAKGLYLAGDIIDPTKPPYMHSQNAYEADE